jgi:alpha-tubulin suppressor-like RCC1 family protein
MNRHARAVLLLSFAVGAIEDSWSQVSSGARHTCLRVKANHCHGVNGACSVKGSIECYGDNQFGQASPPSGLFSKVSAGRDTTCAIKSDGSVTCWGNEETGIVTGAPQAYGFSSLSVGGYHACALRNKNVVCWGQDDYGQISPPEPNMEFTNIACGNYHTCAVQANGYVVCWGNDGEKESTGYPPGMRFTEVTAGNGHSCALTVQRRAVCWGRNKEGQTTVPPGDHFFSALSAGHRHTCAVRDAARSVDQIICWGSNYEGESRALFRGLFEQVSVGAVHSCAVTAAGDVRCWGSNRYGQALGRSTKGLRSGG